MGHVEVPLSSNEDFRRHVEDSLEHRVSNRETYFYYNSGYTMLGKIVEAVTGTPYTTYVEEEILTPLGMGRSTFARDDLEADDDTITTYIKQDGSATETEFPFDPFIYAPGSLLSSAVEMGAYLRMYLNGGSLDGETVLSTDGLEEMTTPAVASGQYLTGRDVQYGYGLSIEEFLDDTLVGHGGAIVVSNARFGYLEEAEVGVAVSCTTTPETLPSEVGRAVLAILQDEDPTEVVPHFELVGALDAVTGEYEGFRDITSATAERDGGGLSFTQDSGLGGKELQLRPETLEEDLLVCSGVLGNGQEHTVRFELDGDDVRCFFSRSLFVKA